MDASPSIGGLFLSLYFRVALTSSLRQRFATVLVPHQAGLSIFLNSLGLISRCNDLAFDKSAIGKTMWQCNTSNINARTHEPRISGGIGDYL